MYAKILVPIDGSPTAERGLREAIALAASQKARLVLLHVVDDYPLLAEMASVSAYQETLELLRQQGRRILARAEAEAAAAGVGAESRLRDVTHQRIADVVLEEAGSTGCQLIVMGTHGRRGFNRLALGSDAEMVLRESPLPVLLVRQPQDGR